MVTAENELGELTRIVCNFPRDIVLKSLLVPFQKGMTLGEMIAHGKYSDVHSLIKDPSLGIETEENLKIVEFPHLWAFEFVSKVDDFLHMVELSGCRFATVGELLLFGANNMKEQEGGPIITFIKGSQYLLVLDCDLHGRTCTISEIRYGLPEGAHYAIVSSLDDL
jgi:hypothetical protein